MLCNFYFKRSFNTFVGRALDPPIEKDTHNLERLGVFSGHGTSSMSTDKMKKGVSSSTAQQNMNQQKVSIQNRANMAKTILNLISFIQKQAPVGFKIDIIKFILFLINKNIVNDSILLLNSGLSKKVP